MTVIYSLAAILAVTVFLLIRAEFSEDFSRIKIFKPVSTILIILIALISFTAERCHTGYSAFIVAGLAFSLAGDIALMLKDRENTFRLGLISFLIAHIIYSTAFTVYSNFQNEDVLWASVLVVIGGLIYGYLYSGLGDMKISVLFYVIIISFMVNRAVSTHYGSFFNTVQAWTITAGAVLFYISDVILAVARFRNPFKCHRVSLAFYYSGQLLIAMSAALF